VSIHDSILIWERPSAAQVKFVNTSMHGVGHSFALQAFEIFGLPKFIPVKEQQNPDPEFPTVKFPNPEEKGASKLSTAR
jgi:phosphomannomutase